MDKRKMLEAMVARYGRGSKTEFAKLIGVTPQFLNHWFIRENFDAERLFKRLPGISASWLLSGEGAMDAPDIIGDIVSRFEALVRENAELRALAKKC